MLRVTPFTIGFVDIESRFCACASVSECCLFSPTKRAEVVDGKKQNKQNKQTKHGEQEEEK